MLRLRAKATPQTFSHARGIDSRSNPLYRPFLFPLSSTKEGGDVCALSSESLHLLGGPRQARVCEKVDLEEAQDLLAAT